jgi:transcriptional regulator with XRE-family HTH domain
MARLLETIRQAIQASELTQREIARQVEIDQSQVSRFAHGERTLSAETLDELCELLGLELVPKRSPAKPKKKS